jgi:hypothetical protein
MDEEGTDIKPKNYHIEFQNVYLFQDTIFLTGNRKNDILTMLANIVN